MKIKTVDIFCEVIDNYGDAGTAYRLYKEIKNNFKDVYVRLFINKFEEINLIKNKDEEINIFKYEEANNLETADLIIECFACNILDKYLDRAYDNSKIWINLEYFSAEDWIEDFHLQESLLSRGKIKKYFFMPGITKKSGGLIVDKEFLETKLKVQKNKTFYLKKYNIPENYDYLISIFSYEKNFDKFIDFLEKSSKKFVILILSEKTQKNFTKYFDKFKKCDRIEAVNLKFLSLKEYEEILSLCDCNFVRGEESFSRSLILGKPFLWHIYPQENNLHLKKLNDFLKKYYAFWEKMQNVFVDYNLDRENYEYFFENFSKISKHNEEFSKFLIKNCNLIHNLKNFLDNIGGN